MTTLLLAAAALVVVVALALIVGVRWLARDAGVRVGLVEERRLVASDTAAAPTLRLRDPEHGLRGKPDHVIEEVVGGRALLVPMEVKPRRRSRRLYEGDALQLAVYLMALRATHGDRAASFGYVRYAEATFRVELTPALEARVVAVADAIRAGRRAAVVHRSHDQPRRCAACAVRESCDESLA